MHFEFEMSCREARARIAVPAVNIVAIRSASAARRPSRLRIFIAVIATALALGAAAAAAVWQAHVYVGTNGAVNLYAHTVTAKFAHATRADALAAARQVDFPVTLPIGLPLGTRLRSVVRADTSAISLTYDLPDAWRRSHHLLGIVLADPNVVGPRTSALPSIRWHLEQWPGSRTVRWAVGGEDVIVTGSLTPAELARLQAAMRAATGTR